MDNLVCNVAWKTLSTNSKQKDANASRTSTQLQPHNANFALHPSTIASLVSPTPQTSSPIAHSVRKTFNSLKIQLYVPAPVKISKSSMDSA